jgi:ERCC4 domain
MITTSPFTVVIDGREKAAWRFTGLRADAKDGGHELVVPTVWDHLETGDYSIKGHESAVCVERKSLQDIYGTLSGHRDRFAREVDRMTEFDRAAIVIEASLEEVVNPTWRIDRDIAMEKNKQQAAVALAQMIPGLDKKKIFQQYLEGIDMNIKGLCHESQNWRSKLNPKTVFRTAISWQQRYQVPWVFAGNRRLAEVYTFRFLERFWKESQ